MLRLNFLKAPESEFCFAGARVGGSLVRDITACALIAAVCSAGVVRFETVRLDALLQKERSVSATLAANKQREEALRALESSIAAFKDVQRQREAAAHSGNDVVLAIAQLGNVLPASVALENVLRQGEGFTVAGDATTTRSLSDMLSALQSGLPQFQATLISTTASANSSVSHFSLRLAGRSLPATR
ncbi:MAG: PilN domain-containing protein [Candidatus Eremiobacteraeota bacterium]|nr:PilN domain-containing protein [Candidatus Eremiobacteraeota bacterium]